MIKITSDVFRISDGIRLCGLFVCLTDIDYDKSAECAVPTMLGFLAQQEDCSPLIKLLAQMNGTAEKAAKNALSAFSDSEKDRLFSAAAVSFGDMANEHIREQDITLGEISEYVVTPSGRYTLGLDFYTVERRSKLCTATVVIDAEDMRAVNDYIMNRISEKPSRLLKIGVNAANNSFILGQLLKFYLPTLNRIFGEFGMCAENLTIA